MANDIFLAVKERKNFILRTVLLMALVIFIFSIFLNKYILKPIRSLVLYTKAIKEKDVKINKHEKYLNILWSIIALGMAYSVFQEFFFAHE